MDVIFVFGVYVISLAFIRLGSRVIARACRDDPDEQVPDDLTDGENLPRPLRTNRGFFAETLQIHEGASNR